MTGIVNSTGARSGVIGTTVAPAVGTGTDGYVLTATGAGAVPEFEAIPAAVSGITEADYWRLTTSFTGSSDPIASNLERCDTFGFGLLGTGMTESSGIFSFPSTGYWSVTFNMEVSYSGDSRFNSASIAVSTNSGVAYNSSSTAYTFIQQTSGSTTYSGCTTSCIIDVTSTSTVKVRFAVGDISTSVASQGNTSTNRTSMQFLKLGDT